MKRSLALLLTSLLLVFSLAACGKDQQPGGVDDANGSVTGAGTTDTGTAGNGGLTGSHGAGTGDTPNSSVTGGVNGAAGGTMMDGAMDTMEDVGDAARNIVRDTGDALTGHTNNKVSGYTYDQMVQNGRVF